MFELNDQELEQVAGGFTIGAGSGTQGGAQADSGTISLISISTSKSTPTEVTSFAGTQGAGKGTKVLIVTSAGAGSSAKS